MNVLVTPGPWCQGAMTQAVPGGQHTHPDWCIWYSDPQAVPIPLPAFLPSTAAENSWILPQDAPSECENSSSARSHSNCSLATRPHLLFSSQCSCVWPPCAAHEAVAAAASPGPQTHPASPSRLHPFDCFTLGDRRDPHPAGSLLGGAVPCAKEQHSVLPQGSHSWWPP